MFHPWHRFLALGLAAWLSGCASRAPAPGGLQTIHEGLPVTPLPVPETQPPPPEVIVPAEPPTPAEIVVPPPTPLTNRLAGTWIALAEWAQANGLAVPVKEPGATNLSFVMRGWQDRLVIRAGNHAVRWNGAECWLGYAPRFQAGQLQVHTLDLEKTIRPLLSGPPALDSKVVVIDPGHGGDNPGTRSAAGPYWEKTFTLDWALRVRDLLTAAGWQVVLTRTNDVNVSSSNRVALADQTQASLFVSLHFNSAPQNAAEAGLETYCLTPAGLPSSLTRGFGDDVRRQHRNNGFDDQNLAWAIRLHRALLQHTGLQDRGVRRARFMTVLQGQHRPAVLLEAGYLSHPAEARKIASPAFRQKLAEAVVHALEPGYLDVLGSR